MLSRDAFLAEATTKIGKHPVPELGGDVGLAEFTVDEADQIRALGSGDVPAAVRVVIMGACDDKGKRLFTEADIPALRGKQAKIVGPLANAILKHNGLTEDAAEDAKND